MEVCQFIVQGIDIQLRRVVVYGAVTLILDGCGTLSYFHILKSEILVAFNCHFDRI